MGSVLGLDIGGANLKAAHSDGPALVQPFALWKNPAGLADQLRMVLQALPSFQRLAVTMTGELCDCFATKREGVETILRAVAAVAGPVPIHVWSTTGQFLDAAQACEEPLQVAAANWHALATFAGRLAPRGAALLIDIGSTTTDIVPLTNGRPNPKGLTDPERLRHHELVYFGVRRTPVCAVLGAQVAAELFATTLDVYVLLGMIPEEPDNCDTADGRPATRHCAHARLARMKCADVETFSLEEAEKLATEVMLWQIARMKSALEKVAKRLRDPPRQVIVAGSGEFLAKSLLRTQRSIKVPRILSLGEQLGPNISQAACAHAVAMLAKETGP